MPKSWYVLNSHPHKENAVWQYLLSKEIEVYYPRLRVKPVNPRSRHTRPYFPGYLFVACDLDLMGQNFFDWMPGARGLVTFDGMPASLDEDLIVFLRKRIGEVSQAGVEFCEDLHPGELVWVKAGPFNGYEAIFDTYLSGEERARVLLVMLNQRRVPVELQAGYLEKKNRCSTARPLWR